MNNFNVVTNIQQVGNMLTVQNSNIPTQNIILNDYLYNNNLYAYTLKFGFNYCAVDHFNRNIFMCENISIENIKKEPEFYNSTFYSIIFRGINLIKNKDNLWDLHNTLLNSNNIDVNNASFW